MDLKPGSRWRSCACGTEVVIVRAATAPAALSCGGQQMQPMGSAAQSLPLLPDQAGGTHAGKRYADGPTGLEVLCTKAGDGSLSVDGRTLAPKDAKKLPASD